MQRAEFPQRWAKAIRLKALTEAGSRGNWSCVAELHVLGGQQVLQEEVVTSA
jgi:hypothetical protein